MKRIGGGNTAGKQALRAGGLSGDLERLLAMPAKGGVREHLEALGVPARERDNRMALAAALLDKALTEGNVPAAKEVRAILAEGGGTSPDGLERLIRGMRET